MRYVPLVNTLLAIGFVAVVGAFLSMIFYTGYIDKLSHTCFILHFTNGFLLLLRSILKTEYAEV
jgi:hypothetical protein